MGQIACCDANHAAEGFQAAQIPDYDEQSEHKRRAPEHKAEGSKLVYRMYEAIMKTTDIIECFAQMTDIAATCTEMNPKFGITGMLAFNLLDENRFQCIQYFEGREEDVSMLIKNISRDIRLKDIRMLHMGTLEHRLVADFSMRFLSLPDFFKQLHSFKDSLERMRRCKSNLQTKKVIQQRHAEQAANLENIYE